MSMMKKKLTIALMTAGMMVGCANTSSDNSNIIETDRMAEENVESVQINVTEGEFLAKTAKLYTSYKVVDDSLEIIFDRVSQSEANSKWPSIKFHPVSGNYDWSHKKGLVLELENKGTEEARIELKVSDNIGIMGAAKHQLDLPIYLPPGVSTVNYLFDGAKKGLEGYRGGSDLSLNTIAEFTLYSVGPISEQTIVVHSIDYID
ncbi:hypothetical protein [Psychromonas sp. MME2]|uniref:hypothetical protein n=1 Tax=unclassified Psychromonas TaxID=2614957 RepID=UPI00339BD213